MGATTTFLSCRRTTCLFHLFFCGGLVGKVVGGFLEVEVDHHNKWKRRCMFSVLRVCGRFVCLLRPDHEETWEKQVKQLIQFRQPTVKVNWCFTSTAAVAEKKMRRRCGCGGWGLRMMLLLCSKRCYYYREEAVEHRKFRWWWWWWRCTLLTLHTKKRDKFTSWNNMFTYAKTTVHYAVKCKYFICKGYIKKQQTNIHFLRIFLIKNSVKREKTL